MDASKTTQPPLVFHMLEAGRYKSGEFLIEKAGTPGVGWELFFGAKYLGAKKTLRASIGAANNYAAVAEP